ncbi:MAG: hypothetical protein RMJ88_16310, partial [Thermogemmata sp.]|nr:hypothetical protein [Thermogemmata sp.]
LARAIQHRGDSTFIKSLKQRAKALAQEVIALGIRIGSMSPTELHECLTACYPLHPLTAITLGPLFRHLAQNERSLFAFLASSEPLGFQEFLRTKRLEDGAYGLDHLYNYVVSSLGCSLYTQQRGKVWAEVQSILDRLNDASELEIKIIKIIGLLQAVGTAAGIPVSQNVLSVALKGTAIDSEIHETIQSLIRRSVVVFRRYSASYALWEGSDLNIDDRLRDARAAVERDFNLAVFLMRHFPPNSMIARRHYFSTGTLRYFHACYLDRGSTQCDLFSDIFSAELGAADGRIVYCLPRDYDDRENMRNIVMSNTELLPVIIALPRDTFDLREICYELACIRWVQDNTPELKSDRTARKELYARLEVIEQSLHSNLEWIFSPQNGICEWYYRGQVVILSSQRQLNDLLSRVCDEVYSATPRWRNELINRRLLTSSAAAARRNLIEAIFENADKEGLGFNGHPPERSMYETLLKSSRIHRHQGGVYGFYPPDAKAEPAVRMLWKTIDEFLAETENRRKSVRELFELLRRPPFGLKDGVLPVLLAVVLVHGSSQVALYEEGTFVPYPNAAVFERLCRSPEKFELQRFAIVGPRADVFQRYAAILGCTEKGKADLISIARSLVRFAKELPEYVCKTQRISELAQRVIRTIREARQPHRLLFDELPMACGFQPFGVFGKAETTQLNEYFRQLRSAFIELQQAYFVLLAEIERIILQGLGYAEPLANARQQIEHDARLVLNLAIDAKLKAFLVRAADNTAEDTTWLESIATLLVGKPPTIWDDQDRARFELQLAVTARTFKHYRILAIEMGKSGLALLDGDRRMFRVSITVPNAEELERIVHLPASLDERAGRVQKQLLQVLRQEQLLDEKNLGVAILADLVRQLLS